MPSRHVALEQLRGRLGVQLVVDVLAAGLVLDERGRVRELADVVVVGRDAGEQRRRAPIASAARLGEVPDHQGVVVRARRLDEQPPQERLGRVRELQQLEHGHDPEHGAQDRERADGRDRGAAGGHGRRADELEDALDVLVAEQREHHHDERLDDEHADARLDEHREPVAAADADDARDPAEQHVGRELEPRSSRRRCSRPPRGAR